MILDPNNCVFFWGDKQIHPYLSNFYECSIEVEYEGKAYKFHSSEQIFMYNKAITFKDHEIAKEILNTKKPIEAKKLGKKVSNFSNDVWITKRAEAMNRALYLKFGLNEELKNKLLSLKDKLLVEASPYDKVWGIGLSADNPSIFNTDNWLGPNLLGICLMHVRDVLYSSSFT